MQGAEMDSPQSGIKALLDEWSEAGRRKDIEQLMALYSPDIVYFDLVPPLQIAGAAAVRQNFLRWFDGWSSGIGAERRDNGRWLIAHEHVSLPVEIQSGRVVMDLVP
jgi:ketosteroid isomerase-like protein